MDVLYENKSEPLFFETNNLLSSMPHLHKELEIIYVVEGNATAFTDRKSSPIGEGDLFIAFPNQIHYYEKCQSGRYFVIIISPDVIFELGSIISSNSPENNVIHISSGDPVRDYLHRAAEETGEYTRTARCGYLNLIMSSIIPRLTLNPLPLSDNYTIRSILDYCTRNFSGSICLDDVSENLHLSKYYISHIINKQLNLSFSDYINTLRVNIACDQLRETDKKIADISEDVGFGTIRSFNRIFRQAMNMTPCEYRRIHGKILKENLPGCCCTE